MDAPVRYKTEATRTNWGTRSGNVHHVGYGEPDTRDRTTRIKTIDGELIAKSSVDTPSDFTVGDRVFHIKFGNGDVSAIDGNKLTIDFDKAGQKRVLDNFVQKL